MVYFAAGWKPGFGPVVKVMKYDSDDYLVTPSTSMDRFFFDSETQSLTYLFDKYYFPTGFDSNVYGAGTNVFQGNAYSLDGPISTAKRGLRIMPYQSGSGYQWGYYEIFERFPDLGIVPMYDIKLVEQDNRVKLFDFDGADGNRQLFSRSSMYSSITTYSTPSTESVVYIANRYDKIHSSFNYTGWVGKATNYMGPQNVYLALATSQIPRVLSCQWDLPALMNVPIPSLSGTPVEGQEVLTLNSSRAALARRGYDTNSTNQRAYLFDSSRQPMQCVMTGETAFIAPGSSVYYPNNTSFPLRANMFLDAIPRYQGYNYSIPPVDPTASRGNSTCLLYYRIDANGITFWNEGNYNVSIRFLLFATDTEGNTTGGSAVMRSLASGDIQIKRPGSSDTNPNPNDILLDTRFPSLRILKEGTIPIGSFSTANSLNTRFGTHAVVIPYDNGITMSNMFIFPKVVGNWPGFLAQGYHMTLRPGTTVTWSASNYSMVTVLRETDMVVHMSPGAATDVQSGQLVRTMPDPEGIRYYIFGAAYK